jgi:hypothetical protein
MKVNKEMQTGLCFIGGSGRSGTTIFKRIFANHPKVTSIPEFRISVDPDGLVDFYQSMLSHWTPYLFDNKLKNLRAVLLDAGKSHPLAKYYHYGVRKARLNKLPYKLESRYTTIGIRKFCPTYDQMVENLIENLTEFKFTGSWTGQHFGERTEIAYCDYPDKVKLASLLGQFYREVASRITQKVEAEFFMDDNTWNILYFPHLLEMIPEAKLVHIYRDPRDVTASYMQQTWAPASPIEAAKFYNGVMDRWAMVKEELSPVAYLEISLDELVQDPEPILRKVADFYGIPWDQSLLQIDLSKSHKGRWKRDIPEELHAEVQKILAEHITNFGYELG